jgi:hypothetical protein
MSEQTPMSGEIKSPHIQTWIEDSFVTAVTSS